MNLTPPADTYENNLHPLCLIEMSVLCWVFIRASFLLNPKKTGIFLLTAPCVIHLDLMLFESNGSALPQNSAYNKYGIRWQHTETIDKKWASSETNGGLKRLIILESCFHLEHMIHLDLTCFGANDDILLK